MNKLKIYRAYTNYKTSVSVFVEDKKIDGLISVDMHIDRDGAYYLLKIDAGYVEQEEVQ